MEFAVIITNWQEFYSLVSISDLALYFIGVKMQIAILTSNQKNCLK